MSQWVQNIKQSQLKLTTETANHKFSKAKLKVQTNNRVCLMRTRFLKSTTLNFYLTKNNTIYTLDYKNREIK